MAVDGVINGRRLAESKHFHIQPKVGRMDGLTRDGTADPSCEKARMGTAEYSFSSFS